MVSVREKGNKGRKKITRPHIGFRGCKIKKNNYFAVIRSTSTIVPFDRDNILVPVIRTCLMYNSDIIIKMRRRRHRCHGTSGRDGRGDYARIGFGACKTSLPPYPNANLPIPNKCITDDSVFTFRNPRRLCSSDVLTDEPKNNWTKVV